MRHPVPFLISGTCGLLLAAAAAGQTGMEGQVCVRDHQPGLSCTANDVLATQLVAVEVLDPCDGGESDTAQVILDVALEAGIGRQDVGIYVALFGGSALLDGACYHDYLAPPLSTSPLYGDENGNAVPDIRNGPWANVEPFDPVDECGDIEGGTEVILSLASEATPLEIACEDTNEDGNVDVDVCVAWSNGTQGHCSSLFDAIASTSARCGCARLEVATLPEPGATLPVALGGALLAALGRRRSPRA